MQTRTREESQQRQLPASRNSPHPAPTPPPPPHLTTVQFLHNVARTSTPFLCRGVVNMCWSLSPGMSDASPCPNDWTLSPPSWGKDRRWKLMTWLGFEPRREPETDGPGLRSEHRKEGRELVAASASLQNHPMRWIDATKQLIPLDWRHVYHKQEPNDIYTST